MQKFELTFILLMENNLPIDYQINNEESPLKEALTINFFELYKLSPLQKIKKYGIIPWKFLIHIFLLIFTILEAIIAVNSTTTYLYSQEKTLRTIFLSEDYNVIYLYSPKEIKTFVKKSLYSFDNINKLTLNQIKNIKQPIIEFNYLKFGNKTNYNQSFEIFNLSDIEFKEKLNTVNNFIIKYSFIKKEHCLIDIIQHFDFRNRGHFIVSLSIKHNNLNSNIINLTDLDKSNSLLHFIVLILSLWSLILTWSNLSNISDKYTSYERNHSQNKGNITSMSSSSSDSSIYYNPVFDSDINQSTNPQTKKAIAPKRKIYKHMAKYVKWSFICLIGNIIQILGASISLFKDLTDTAQILIGLGSFFACLNIVRYIELNKLFSELYDTLKHAFPKVNRYLFSVSPIIFGFLFFGVCVFWESERFGNVSKSILTLFALMNGDSTASILTNLKNLQGIKGLIGILYGMLFSIVVIMIILNLFIQIIDDSYVVVKLSNKSSFILKYIKKENEQKRNGLYKTHNQRKLSQSMPKLSEWNSKGKGNKRALLSNQILTLKNKEMSYPNNIEDSYDDKKSFKLSRSRKEMFEFSLSIPQFSIIEKDEKSFSSSLPDDIIKENIPTNSKKMEEYNTLLLSYVSTIKEGLDNLKDLITYNRENGKLPTRKKLLKQIKEIRKEGIKIKELCKKKQ